MPDRPEPAEVASVSAELLPRNWASQALHAISASRQSDAWGEEFLHDFLTPGMQPGVPFGHELSDAVAKLEEHRTSAAEPRLHDSVAFAVIRVFSHGVGVAPAATKSAVFDEAVTAQWWYMDPKQKRRNVLDALHPADPEDLIDQAAGSNWEIGDINNWIANAKENYGAGLHHLFPRIRDRVAYRLGRVVSG